MQLFFKVKNQSVKKIYQNIVKRSRSKFFYIKYNLEDSFETRFDLIIFHAFMILNSVFSGITYELSRLQSNGLVTVIITGSALESVLTKV